MAKTHDIEFTISPTVSVDDIEQLTRIHVDALGDDESAAVKFATKEEFREKVEQMLRGQLGTLHNAIDEMSKEAYLDTADWHFAKTTLKSPQKQESGEEIPGGASWLHETVEQEGTQSQSQVNQRKDNHSSDRKSELIDFGSGLGTFVRQRQRQVYADWNRQRLEINQPSDTASFISLRSVFVDPRYQRQGIGAALVRYGCERADRLGLHTLVTATPVAKKLYETAGDFEAFDWLELD